MKEALGLATRAGAFLFRVVLKLKFVTFSVYRRPSTPPRISFMLGFAGRTEHARSVYSVWFSSGLNARTSASLANLRLYLGLSAI